MSSNKSSSILALKSDKINCIVENALSTDTCVAGAPNAISAKLFNFFSV